jgi:hypothetical protein
MSRQGGMQWAKAGVLERQSAARCGRVCLHLFVFADALLLAEDQRVCQTDKLE